MYHRSSYRGDHGLAEMSAVQESAGCQVIVFKKNSEPNSDCKQLFFFVIANDWVMA